MMSGILLFPVTTIFPHFTKENRTYCNSSDLLVCCTAFAVFLYLNFIKASTSAVIDLSNFTWQATLKKIGTSIFNFNYDTTPLWYLYMLIGVYLFIPIIGVWLNTASAKDIRLFWFLGYIAYGTLH